ncbi:MULTISPECIES: carbohydrate kinase family protein [unclassified Massilia]|uniref:carbohydrate kinase family protein n=1 Tax=unclassified Massilia TaxID=2609279 RepID=UPI001B8407E4|nr:MULTISPECIES: carbohydrate kinase family protein [unclassified Massilia]MBQ5939966.1 carbohydrate kinase family protein [Massilia sp. AB1]MBQ5964277.1 carbohydrate kinase family protein [Massilia sp. ZL223]
MTHTALICGSIAFDKIMQYHGRFAETLLADQLHRVNVSFLVPTLRTEYGGCSVNIAYNLKLLGGDPLIMGTIGQDGGDYLERLGKQGIATRGIRTIADAYTAQCFVTADQDNNQINAFHPGAMQFSHENSVAEQGPLRVAIISPDGRDGMIKHARDCAELGVPVMFDPGQQLPMFSGEELIRFIDQASYLACNDYEFEMVMDRTGLTLADIAGRLEALIVTRGGEGSDIYAGGEHHRIPAVPAAEVLDPTGCGDAYRAGLLYGIVNGLDWPTSGRIASLLGSIKIARQGAQNHSFTKEEFDQRFEAAFGYTFR